MPHIILNRSFLVSAVCARVDGPSRAGCSTRALSSGTVEIQILAHLSGTYRLYVTLGGHRIANTPYSLLVRPNPAASPRRGLLSTCESRAQALLESLDEGLFRTPMRNPLRGSGVPLSFSRIGYSSIHSKVNTITVAKRVHGQSLYS